MDVLALKHKENILYREDELKNRIELLHRWTSKGEVSLEEFEVLLECCTEKQLAADRSRRDGFRLH